MTQKPILVFVPFEELIEEIEPLNDVFWFLDYDIKQFIANLVSNLREEECKTFKNIDITDLMISLYGTDLGEFFIQELFLMLDRLDRTNTSPILDTVGDEILIQTVSDKIKNSLENKLSMVMGDIFLTEISDIIEPCWNNDRLIIALKK